MSYGYGRCRRERLARGEEEEDLRGTFHGCWATRRAKFDDETHDPRCPLRCARCVVPDALDAILELRALFSRQRYISVPAPTKPPPCCALSVRHLSKSWCSVPQPLSVANRPRRLTQAYTSVQGVLRVRGMSLSVLDPKLLQYQKSLAAPDMLYNWPTAILALLSQFLIPHEQLVVAKASFPEPVPTENESNAPHVDINVTLFVPPLSSTPFMPLTPGTRCRLTLSHALYAFSLESGVTPPPPQVPIIVCGPACHDFIVQRQLQPSLTPKKRQV